LEALSEEERSQLPCVIITSQSIDTFYPSNNLIDRFLQPIWWGDRFVPDRVLPGFVIEASLSIDVNIEFEPDIMIKARENYAI